QPEASIGIFLSPSRLNQSTCSIRIIAPPLLQVCHPSRRRRLRPVGIVKQLWIEVALRLSLGFLSVSPMLRCWTKLLRIRPNESIDQWQVKRMRTQSQPIEGARQSTCWMFGSILPCEQANQRTPQIIGEDLALIFDFRLNHERIGSRSMFETQCLSHQAEHF